MEHQEECIEKNYDSPSTSSYSNINTESESNLNCESSSTLTKLINKRDPVNGPASALAHICDGPFQQRDLIFP